MAHQHPPNGGQHPWASTSEQSSLPSNVPSPYDDPSTILRVYPLVNYTPTARVAGHFAPHTVAYQPPASSASLYPQYQAGFQRLDNPQTAEDLLMRSDVLHRIAPMIQGSSYGDRSYTIQPPPAQHAFPPHPTFPPTTFNPTSFPPATNGFGNPGPVPDFVNHRPMAYDFFPSTPTSSSSVQPPTPSSVAGSSPAPSVRGDQDFFEQFIDRTSIGLQLDSPSPYTGPHTAPPSQAGQSKPGSVNVTPTHLRTGIKMEEEESPDPLSLSGPSPSKKHKSATDLRASSSKSPSKSRQSSVVVLIPTKRADLVDNDPSLRTLSDRARSTSSLHSTPALDNHESDDDEINWGDGRKIDTDGDYHMSHGAVENQAQYLPTGGRTGERDQRSSYQKLQNLLEDIFEEQDSFAAEPSLEDVSNSRFFSGVSSDGAHALLSVDTLNKVARYVSRLQHKKKRQRSKSDGGGIPWDADSILRILKMMEKIMREAEYATPFPDSGRHATGTSASPQKKKKGGKKAADEALAAGDEGTPEVDEADMLELEHILATMSTAASAALCCLVTMATDGLPKQLFSEDLLSLSVLTVRHSMDSVIFKVVEGLASDTVNSNRLALVVNAEAAAAANGRSRKADPLFKNENISSIAQATCASVPHIAGLLDRPDMSLSEELFTATVYMAIGPVFVREPATRRSKKEGGHGPAWSVMKSLRMESLGCLRGAFAHYEDQRLWIIDMILQSLSKVQEQGSAQPHFQLSDGNSIHTLSALLLQLVQASSYGVGSRIRRLRRFAEASSEIPDPEKAQQGEIQILGEAFDAALRSTKTIAGHLVQKAGASKASKSSGETDFKAILDTFVVDLLTVAYRPEWPAAPLFLNILSKIFISALDNQRTTHEAAAARAVAMDYLGDIAARLRALHQQIETKDKVPSLDEIIADANVTGMAALVKAQTTIQSFLSTASREDSMFVSSGEMSQMLWAQELDAAQRKVISVLEKVVTEVVDEDEDGEAPGSQKASVNRDNLQIISREIGLAIRKVWNPEDQLFEISDPHQADEALQASLAISRSRPLQGAFEPILRALSIAMNSTVVGLRSKAIRGLGSVVVADPDLLSQDSVRHALELGLSDSSPQVRDAAVDLVGKYVVQRSNLAVEYYPLIAERITDTGLGVRKRVIRLLRGIFEATDDHDTRIEICYQLLRAGAEDEDEGVQELAIKSLSDIIYPNVKFVAEETAGLLVDILGKFRSNESLESALQAISAQCTKNGHSNYFAQTLDALINRLVEATEESDFDVPSHIRAIELLSSDNPGLIETKKASILLTFLRQATDESQQMTNDLLLQIFSRSIPFLPKAATTFAQDLSKTVFGMITKPTSGLNSLRPLVSCYCSVVNNLTRDHETLGKLLFSCIGRTRKQIGAIAQMNQAQFKGVAMVFYIIALIAEYGKLETVAQTDDKVRNIVDRISQRPLSEHLFDAFLEFAMASTSQHAPMLCLSALYRSNPRLIIHEKSTRWMRSIIDSPNMDNQARVLQLLHDFLASQAAQSQPTKTAKATDKGVSDLIGSGADLHQSSVSTALVQANIDFITKSAMSTHNALQAAAMEVFSFTVNQGLYHPGMLLPILVSLETSPSQRIARRALTLHTSLHTKHASMLSVNYLHLARETFNYQKTLTSEVFGERNGEALLGGWYELLSEKRAWKIAFLQQLSKAFDYELMGDSPMEPEFALYIAENLAVLEYQAQEEVMVVVQQLSQAVRDGLGVANSIEEAKIMATMGSEPIIDKAAIVSETDQIPAIRLANAASVVGIALLTKSLLLSEYGLTEDKCLKLVAGKKNPVGDKPATRRSPQAMPLDSSRLAYPRGVETVDEYFGLQSAFLQLMREDGSLGLPV